MVEFDQGAPAPACVEVEAGADEGAVCHRGADLLGQSAPRVHVAYSLGQGVALCCLRRQH